MRRIIPGGSKAMLLARHSSVRTDEWRANSIALEPPGIIRRIAPAGFAPRVQVRQFHQQDSSLQGVEPEVTAHVLMEVLWFCTMIPEQSHLLVERLIVSDDHAAVAGAEIGRAHV